MKDIRSVVKGRDICIDKLSKKQGNYSMLLRECRLSDRTCFNREPYHLTYAKKQKELREKENQKEN